MNNETNLPGESNTNQVKMNSLFRNVKRLIIFIIGGTVVLIGIAMIVLPGPAIVVIPAGLAILATEFVWAKNLLHKVKEKAMQAKNKILGKSDPPGSPDAQ
jgi:tellurite resistance protein TerC